MNGLLRGPVWPIARGERKVILAACGVPVITECLALVTIALRSSPNPGAQTEHPNRPLMLAIVASAQLWLLNDAALLCGIAVQLELRADTADTLRGLLTLKSLAMLS
jgi:hypothetical protein